MADLKWRWLPGANGLQVWRGRPGGWFYVAYLTSADLTWRFWNDRGVALTNSHLSHWGTDPAPTRAFVDGLERPPHD